MNQIGPIEALDIALEARRRAVAERYAPEDAAWLSEQAVFIRWHYEKSEQHARSSVFHALAAGRRLFAVSDSGKILPGDWDRWITEETRVPLRSARRYIRVVGAIENNLPKWQSITEAFVLEVGIVAADEEVSRIERGDLRHQRRHAPVIEDGMELRIGRFQDVLADVPDHSVPLILTDPPYGVEAESLYRDLAAFAGRVLAPGGSMVCYTGHACLPRDIAIFSEHLDWVWLLGMRHDQTQRFPGANILVGFKPVLWFSQGKPRDHMAFCDLLESPERDKVDHPWGQGEGGVKFVIEALTLPNELVVDPFAGTCQWGRLAVKAGCRWLGADVKEGGDAVIVV